MNWIENAEEKQRIKDYIVERNQGIVGDNIKQNNELILPLLGRIKELVDRISQISLEYRKPCTEIGFTEFDGDVKSEFYGSAITFKKKKFLFLDLGEESYTCWRRIVFKVTDQYDKVKIIISEKCVCEKDKNKSYGIREKYKFSISELKVDLSEEIVNWLVYKISNNEMKSKMPISYSHKKHNKNR